MANDERRRADPRAAETSPGSDAEIAETPQETSEPARASVSPEDGVESADASGSPAAPSDESVASASSEDATDAHDETAVKPQHRKPGHAKEDDRARKLPRKDAKELLDPRDEKIARLTEQADALQADVKDLKDKWLRSAADFENYRKRTRREWELLQQRSKAEIVLDVLAVVDDLERAFSVVGDREDEFVRGIRLIYNNLMASLEKNGVRRIEALGAAFDPTYHMAVAQLERDGADSAHVIEVVQQGYCLGDSVVRPAKVVIAK